MQKDVSEATGNITSRLTKRTRPSRAPWGSLKIPRVHTDENDIYDYQYRLAHAFSMLERSNKISLRDKELIRNFDKILQATSVSIGRRAKYIYHLKTIAENFGLPFESAKRSDIEHFVGSWLNTQGYRPETRNNYIIILKRFYKFIRAGSVDRGTISPRGQISKEHHQAKRKSAPGILNAK